MREINAKGESKMDEQGNNLGDWATGQGLPPVDSLDREGARVEIAKMNTGGPSHPFWDDNSPFHGQAVKRMHDLLGRMPRSDEEMRKIEEPKKKAFDEEQDRLWGAYEAEQFKQKFEKAQDALAARLAKEGKSLNREDAGLVLSEGAEFVRELKKQGLIRDDFFEYLDQTGQGDDLDSIRAFAHFKGLMTKYESWRADKAKGGGR